MPKLEDFKTQGVSPEEFLSNMKPLKYKKDFEAEIKNSTIKEDVVAQIAEITKKKKFSIRIFAALWCKDTKRAFPAFLYISKYVPGIDLQILGGIKNVPFDPNVRWKVPPSPPEVDTFDIRGIPTVIFFDANGEEIGRTKEPPEITESVEEEFFYYLQMLPD